MEQVESKSRAFGAQGCALAAGGLLLACILLVIGPTGYAFYRYRAAQIFSGNVVASGQLVTLPTRSADTYTLTLQPQTSALGGITLGFILRDTFGRTLAAETDFYTTGCPPSSPANTTCPAQSHDFEFNDKLGGPVQLTLQATQPDAQVAIQVRDESAGGIFASGSLVIFGLFLGCGSLLWIVVAALIIVFAHRLERQHAAQERSSARAQSESPERVASDQQTSGQTDA